MIIVEKLELPINMGPVEPPPQKGRLPLYNRSNLEILQAKFDTLEELGVMARPEDLGIVVEHVSPSFLVKKTNGDHRLVTNFSNIGSYAKTVPCKMTTSDEVLRFLAQWKYIIKTDMTTQFFQLAMIKKSL